MPMSESTLETQAPAEEGLYEYRSGVKPTWCPGCGDFGVLTAITNTLKRMELNPDEVVALSGIGCSSRISYFLNTYGFHGVHGRTMPIALGIRLGNPALKLVVFGGDGDGFAIGGGHFLHGARRNADLMYVVMDNQIYGLTKGQTSPTSALEFVTKSTPGGNLEQPIHPLMLALACGATFVGQANADKIKETEDMMLKAMNHRGFAFINLYSACPTFNKINTHKWYRTALTSLPDDHDATSFEAAMALLSQRDKAFSGVLYQVERPTYEDSATGFMKGDYNRETIEKTVTSLMNKFA